MLAGTRYRKPAKGKGVGRRKPFTLTRVNLELVKGGREAVALVPVLTQGKRAFYWSPAILQQLHVISFSLYDNHVKMALVSPFYPEGKWDNLPKITQRLRLLSGKGSLNTKHTPHSSIQRGIDCRRLFPIWRFGLLSSVVLLTQSHFMTISHQGDDSTYGPLRPGLLSLQVHQKRCCRPE